MTVHFSLKKRVEFADTDAAGIMHFSNYFRFMEVCEHAFFRSRGLSILPGGENKKALGWPRVQVACDYKQPLYFEDLVEVELTIKELAAKTIAYEFCFWVDVDDEANRKLVATGKFTVIGVRWDAVSGKMKAVEIPQQVREKLEAVITK